MKLSKTTHVSIAVCAFLFSQNLFSQEVKEDSTKTKAIDEVVITGSKTYRQAGNVTQKIDVIKSKEIELAVSGQSNLAELTARKPGTSVAALSVNYPNWGTNAGLGMKYSTYMLDGLPIDAFLDPIALDAKAISRIEIQRGPASVLYPNFLSQEYGGSQSSLGGTINLILKKHITNRETSALLSYGSFNTLNAQVYHQDKVSEGFNYFAGVNYENSDYTNYGIPGSWLDMNKSPEYRKIKMYAGANLFYGSDKKNSLSIFVNRTTLKGDEGRVYRAYEFDLTNINITNKIELSEDVHFNASGGLRFQGKEQQGDNKVNNQYILSKIEGHAQTIVPVDINVTYQHGKSLLTVGADYQNVSFLSHIQPFVNDIAGADQKKTKTRHHQLGIYAQEEYNIDDFTLRGGLRYTNYTAKVDLVNTELPGTDSVSFSKLLWSFGAKYNHQYFTLYSNIGNSFRAPGMKDLAGNIKAGDTVNPGQLPSPNLKPETGIGYDLGIDIKPIENFKVGVRGYYIKIDNFASLVNVRNSPSQSQAVLADGEKLVSKGLEIDVNHAISNQLNWFANFTYFDAKKVKPSGDSKETFTPDMIFNAGLFYNSTSGFKFNPMINYTGKYFDGATEFKPGAIINVFVGQTIINKKDFGLDLFVKTYNLTNNKFEMPWQFQNTGFAITGGFVINFK